MPLSPRRVVAPLLVGLTIALAGLPPAAGAQETGAYSIRLVGQPFSHDDEDVLGLRVKVTNLAGPALEGFRLQISSYERVLNRSELAESFDGNPVGEPTASTFEEFDGPVETGASKTVTLTTPTADMQTLAAGTGGVYPLGIELTDKSGASLGAGFVTELVYYPGEQPATQLGAVLVVPLHDLAARGPDGVFSTRADGAYPLEAALLPEGWLRGTLDAMQDAAERGMHFGLAPTPRLVEEITDMANGYTRRDEAGDIEQIDADSPPAEAAAAALQDLRELVDTKGVQPLLVPYSFADLPTLARSESGTGPRPLARQLTVAEEVLEILGSPESGFTRRWVFAPAGRLDADTLAELQASSRGTATRTFFAADALAPPADPDLAGCPEAVLSFTCPVSVSGSWGTSQGYRSNPGLQERFIALAHPGEDRLDLQRILAETAMLREELPGREDRLVQATMPSLWHPRARLASLLFRSLARSEWLETLTPNQGLHHAASPVDTEPVAVIPSLPRTPGEAFFSDVASAEETVANFADVGAPEEMVTRLQRDILVAHSRSWWQDDELFEIGRSYASEARSEAEEHLGRISILAAPDITMTSRRADVQLIVSNDNPYPVKLDIGLESPNLRVDALDIPTEFPAEARTPVQASVAAQTSGIFQVSLTANTPSGYEVDELVISVRSTEFNRIALGLTLGALAFLVSFYAYRGVRRQRAAGDSGAATA